MAHIKYSLTLLACCTLLCVVAGCSEEISEPTVAIAPAKPSVARPKPIETTDTTTPTPPEAKQKPKVKAKSTPPKTETVQAPEYQPPFPERENPFLAPKRNSAVANGPADRAQETVMLLGFANVNGPRVILSINGSVYPVAEGGKEMGIEVISIKPPAVVLQRDRERWQATLEN